MKIAYQQDMTTDHETDSLGDAAAEVDERWSVTRHRRQYKQLWSKDDQQQ